MSEVKWYRDVRKHLHFEQKPSETVCDRPWTAEHLWGRECPGLLRFCWTADYPTQPEALAALEAHLKTCQCDSSCDTYEPEPEISCCALPKRVSAEADSALADRLSELAYAASNGATVQRHLAGIEEWSTK